MTQWAFHERCNVVLCLALLALLGLPSGGTGYSGRHQGALIMDPAVSLTSHTSTKEGSSGLYSVGV